MTLFLIIRNKSAWPIVHIFPLILGWSIGDILSIIHQSYHAKERIESFNGDGFGIGWYAPQFCCTPALFKEVSSAWSNQNLKDIARVAKSNCILQTFVQQQSVDSQLGKIATEGFIR